ncbi:hypothetical protein LINGRAHAP2_LOCUS1633 [Linum grandiflorum]
MTTPDSLVSRLYRAKYYYPTCDILTSPIGHRPRFVWRSIWNSLHLVCTGYRWRIGNGLNIRV